ncbi:MAG: hypothetical protein A3J35_00350 [Gammaproteobacteria bacterium RIFCSPLOWO2_02_FULL_52_10]|nr:MAG: hypothetical protein A3J35_00350 [Gammaproteobacteria bacterium RIFCSPLOWO2_02_FULL_52_10]
MDTSIGRSSEVHYYGHQPRKSGFFLPECMESAYQEIGQREERQPRIKAGAVSSQKEIHFIQKTGLE